MEFKDEKTKLIKERFGKKAFFKTVVNFPLEAKKVRISYEYETHEVEFIVLSSLFTIDVTASKLRSVMLKILRVLRFDKKIFG